jgi:antitoxin (DNA-binding transcriptional repressor) of toxin-antitoxin stability system
MQFPTHKLRILVNSAAMTDDAYEVILRALQPVHDILGMDTEAHNITVARLVPHYEREFRASAQAIRELQERLDGSALAIHKDLHDITKPKGENSPETEEEYRLKVSYGITQRWRKLADDLEPGSYEAFLNREFGAIVGMDAADIGADLLLGIGCNPNVSDRSLIEAVLEAQVLLDREKIDAVVFIDRY